MSARAIYHLEGGELVVTVPVKVLSEANRRDHWAAKHRRAKAQRNVVGLSLRAALGRSPSAASRSP